MEQEKHKKDVVITAYEGHCLFSVEAISRVWIYYGDGDPVIKISFKNHAESSQVFTLSKNRGECRSLYTEILKAIQKANSKKHNDYLIIYGKHADLLSEVNLQ